MTLQQLKYITTIAEAGSMNKAAEMLYLAQPSLTGAVKELEKELGFEIFNRNGRGVSLTNDGSEFLLYAREILFKYENMLEKYGKNGARKQKFGVSTQHFSFAVKAFVEMTESFDITKYEFAIRETKTKDVLDDVHTMRSEVGVIYLSDFNRNSILKLLSSSNLEFVKLIDCRAYVYLWKNHPLASKKVIKFGDLSEYPCIQFEQGENSSFYLAEELLSTADYPKTIKVCDRATVLNLMVGLNGYTICSGIICEELNGTDYVAIPIKNAGFDEENAMEIGYVIRKNSNLSAIGSIFIEKMKDYLNMSNPKQQ